MDEIDGVWRTIRGRRVFIKTGQSLSDAIRESGKFSNNVKNKIKVQFENKNKKVYNTIESFKCLEKYSDMGDEEYKRSYTSKNDYIMEEMAKENGFDKLPTKVSEKEYDNLVKEGHIRVQRVISDDNNHTSDYYINEFKNGKYFATGNANMYGNGIYTSANEKDIDTYTYSDRNSKVMHMAIDKKSKIMEFKNQSDMLQFYSNEYRKINKSYQRVMSEPGKLLVSKGYDASYIEDMNYYIIYNRGIVYVEDEL